MLVCLAPCTGVQSVLCSRPAENPPIHSPLPVQSLSSQASSRPLLGHKILCNNIWPHFPCSAEGKVHFCVEGWLSFLSFRASQGILLKASHHERKQHNSDLFLKICMWVERNYSRQWSFYSVRQVFIKPATLPCNPSAPLTLISVYVLMKVSYIWVVTN